MIFPDPLFRGTLVRRYKRFLADVVLETGETVTAHCANSGSMLSVDAPGSEVWLSPARNPDRKLKYTWELIRVGNALVGINTAHPNAIVAEAVAANEIPELSGYTSARREVKYGKNSRIDLLLEGSGQPRCFVEVKNVTLKREDGADRPVEFPDAVTARGTKHLVELSEKVREGDRAVMMYLVQRDDADWFTLADDIDPAYAEAFEQATAVGVEALCYRCDVSSRDIRISHPIRISRPGQTAR
jgi:sugar fermentation stimulation protein A